MRTVLMRVAYWGVLLAGTLALLSGVPAAAGQQSPMTFYVIAHTGPGDPFWAVVQRGVEDAGRMLGVRAIFQGPTGRNIPEQVNMFRAAVAAGATGIATTISDPRAWVQPIREARERGIPVVAINVKEPPDFTEPIPYMAYIGMDEYQAGRMLAERLASKLPRGARALVAIHEPGHVGLEARARGIMEVLSERLGARVDKLDITQDPTRALTIMRSYLRANPDTAAIFTLGPLGAIPAIRLVREENLVGKVLLASFDLDPTVVQAIKEGIVDATVDQQQYLQGFMSVVQLYLYARFGLQPVDYDTGRGLVDASNVAMVEELVRAGYR